MVPGTAVVSEELRNECVNGLDLFDTRFRDSRDPDATICMLVELLHTRSNCDK